MSPIRQSYVCSIRLSYMCLAEVAAAAAEAAKARTETDTAVLYAPSGFDCLMCGFDCLISAEAAAATREAAKAWAEADIAPRTAHAFPSYFFFITLKPRFE